MSSHLEDLVGGADQLLVERHRGGDETAFAELYARHYRRLLRFVRARVRERHVAEDVTQEAFTKALVALGTLRDPARFYPWLTVIARHLVVHHHRSSAHVAPFVDLDPVSTADAPESRLLREAEQEEVRQALERVRHRHREILQMRERDELSYDDIARVLGTPATTIPPLLFRARAALRREYLAMTEEERKLVGVPLLFDAVRRFRARAAQYVMWLPDANALCASVACVALGVGVWAYAHPAAELAPRDSVPVNAAAVNAAAADPDSAGREGAPLRSQGLGRVSAQADPTPGKVVQGVAEINLDNPERTGWTRERAREMPIYYEFGPAGFAADPDQMQRDIESSLEGDTEWMEGSS